MSSINSISAEKLSRLIGVPHGPALIDVRSIEDHSADPDMVPGALRRDPATVSDWASEFNSRDVVVIGQNGRSIAEGVAAWLRHA